MGWLSVLLDVIGIGKGALERKAKRKQTALESKLKIEEAIAQAKVNNILNNNVADNQMDLIKVNQQANSLMDELVSIIFLLPLLVASITPFLIIYNTQEWTSLMDELMKSYESLAKLPKWFIGGIFLVITNILGFRSFLRRAFSAFLDKYMAKANLLSNFKK